MTKDPWYDSDNPSKVARGAGWRIALWVIAVVLFFALIGGAAWGFRVLTSDVAGQGNAVIQKNSANNRIAAQQTFEDLIADIKASDRKLDPAAADKKANPGNDTYSINYAGLVAHCLDTVGIYDADARKYTAAQFRASDLPAQIDITDPSTDCKETSTK